MKNHRGYLKLSISAVLVCICALFPLRVHASSGKEKALLAASANSPLVFTVPFSQGLQVMGKAKSLIAHWDRVDSGPFAANIQKASDNHIWTHAPAFPNEVGFSVGCTVTDSGDEISVAASSVDNQFTDSRGHMLAYLLEQYAAALPAGPPPNVTTSSGHTEPGDSQLALPANLEKNLDLIRSQLAGGQYDAALSSIDSLKSAVIDKQKEHAGAAPIAAHP